MSNEKLLWRQELHIFSIEHLQCSLVTLRCPLVRLGKQKSFGLR